MAIQGEFAYIADECGGFGIVNISNPEHPVGVGVYDPIHYPWGVAVSGNYAYFTEGYSKTIKSVDISNPARPTVLDSIDLTSNCKNVAVIGDYVYAATQGECLQIFNVSNPAHLVYAGEFQVEGYAYNVDVYGDYAYVSSGDGFHVIDISDIENPDIVTSFAPPYGISNDIIFAGDYAIAPSYEGLLLLNLHDPERPRMVNIFDQASVRDVKIVNDIAYMVTDDYSLIALGISRPLAPVVLDELEFSGLNTHSLAIRGMYAYVVGNDNNSNGMIVVDISNPSNMNVVVSTGWDVHYSEIEVRGNFAFAIDNDVGLRVIDITNPAHPVEVAAIETPGSAENMELSQNFVYIADYTGGVRIIDISNPQIPLETGYYLTNGNACDVAVLGDYVLAGCYYWFNILDCSEAINPGGYTNSGNEELNVISILPLSCTLSVNPNPFNPTTTIAFALPEAGYVSLTVYDIQSREVAKLVNEHHSSGEYQAVFDGSDLASGIYFARLDNGELQMTQKLLLIK